MKISFVLIIRCKLRSFLYFSLNDSKVAFKNRTHKNMNNLCVKDMHANATKIYVKRQSISILEFSGLILAQVEI